MGDAALAAAIAVVQVVGTYLAGRHQTDRESFDAVAGLLLVAGPAALVVRRRYPVPVYLTAFVTTLTYTALGYPRGPIFFALIVSFLTAAVVGHRVVAWSVLGIGYLSFLLVDIVFLDEPGPGWVPAVGLAAWLIVLAAAGEGIRIRRARVEEAARTREEEARRRASEERLRIARELHDVLAHNISLINVQAGVALHLIDQQPEQARSALAAIKQASKEALSELRSVLDVLRQVDEQEPRAPAPGLKDLDALVSKATAAGLEVRVEISGTPQPLPSGVDLAAYRIVQEALTNVVRHAGPAAATVRVAYSEAGVTLQVEDDGLGSTGTQTSNGGNGIAGMRERVAALGGRFEAGPRDEGGFRVRAQLPVSVEGSTRP